MRQNITDEIIDAIIQNEGRHVQRPCQPSAPRWATGRHQVEGDRLRGPERAPGRSAEDPDPGSPA
jgi:hypothetical protein